MKNDDRATETKRYQEMLQEVEGIIQEISREDVDLDHMVQKVEKGYEMIKVMRDRLTSAKEKIETLQMNFSESSDSQEK